MNSLETAAVAAAPTPIEDRYAVAATLASGRLPGLDGLRAVAALMVIVCHGLAHSMGLGGYGGPLFRLGSEGVQIFMVLSGFLITWLLLKEESHNGSIDLRAFYRRRFLRIQPAAITFLGVVSILGILGTLHINWWDVAPCVFGFRNLTDGQWITSHFWSLSVEEQFYLIWPALLVVIRRPRRRFIAVGASIVLFLISHRLAGANANGFRSDMWFDAILTGCGLALLKSNLAAGAALGSGIWQSKWMLTLAVSIVIVAIFPYHLNHLRTANNLAIALLINYFIEHPGTLLDAPLMRWFGGISYSLYLWQELVFNSPSTALLLPIRLLELLVLAVLSFYLVERPFNRISHSTLTGKAATP
jgi:peptidoglycan/LPS O-acetylase OafA/YrhL